MIKNKNSTIKKYLIVQMHKWENSIDKNYTVQGWVMHMKNKIWGTPAGLEGML